MGNLTSNIGQNIQEFANNLIEEERSKSNSLNQSSTQTPYQHLYRRV